MEPSQKLGIAAVITAIAAGVFLALTPGEKADVIETDASTSKVAFLEDGTKVYVVPVKLRDGGVSYDEKTAAEAPCKRRPKGVDGSLCQYQGKDAPELNRYPAALMTGPGCQGVACSIFLGEDAEAEEVRK